MKQDQRVLCLNCEEHTGSRAVRSVTPEGTCYTCGSRSILNPPPPVWNWVREAERTTPERTGRLTPRLG